jgi:nitric oxide reductase large subunit
VSAPHILKPPTGFRRVERWLVGIAMVVIAFVVEKFLLRSVKKGAPPHPTTLTSKGGEVDID